MTDALPISAEAVSLGAQVLGGILSYGPAIEDADEAGLRTKDMATDQQRTILAAMHAMRDAGRPIETTTLIEHLSASQTLEGVGGVTAIAQLSALVVTAAHVGTYARDLREHANLRRIAEACHHVQRAAIERDGTASEVLARAQDVFLRLNQRSEDDLGIADRHALVREILNEIHKPIAKGLEPPFPDLARLVEGFKPGELIVIGARPGMGKTALCSKLATHIVETYGTPIGLFSLEMSAKELVKREIAEACGFNAKEWASNPQAERAAHKAAARVAVSHALILDNPDIDIATVRAKARRLKHKHGIAACFVDYLGLVETGGKYEGNRVNEVSEISRGLKAMAKELQIPVFALSQLSRKCEDRTDKRPLLSDLRDSGSVEQDADVVLLMYREEYYLKDKCPDDARGIVEVNVAKQRNGGTGIVKLGFDANTASFGDVESQALATIHRPKAAFRIPQHVPRDLDAT